MYSNRSVDALRVGQKLSRNVHMDALSVHVCINTDVVSNIKALYFGPQLTFFCQDIQNIMKTRSGLQPKKHTTKPVKQLAILIVLREYH